MTEFSFRIDGPILAWMRPAQRGKRRFDPPEQEAYKRMVAILCKQAMMKAGIYKPLEGPVSLGVAVFYPRAKRHTDHPDFKTSRPDFDNTVKNIKDAVNKVAWIDDSQVCHYKEGGKFYDDRAPEGGVGFVRISPAGAAFHAFVTAHYWQ